ncbi:unnamed protein product [Paramecium primaurelia]|uniref:Uncharacterized protein n=1 Tax=Paramecium primaurelia TaxID=5886 RepID=A0A8S1M5X6_PARPR|nr:unnamed protein product [Paramecium primaurelia]
MVILRQSFQKYHPIKQVGKMEKVIIKIMDNQYILQNKIGLLKQILVANTI